MARADLLTSLVMFGVNGDKARFRKVTETIISGERAKQHTVLADKLEKMLQHTEPENKPATNGTVSPLSTQRIDNLLHEVIPKKLQKNVLIGTYARYLQDDKRVCIKAVDNLWEKYAVTAKKIEAERDKASAQLHEFLVELGYES